MKTIILLLISISSYAQVSIKFVERMIQRTSVSSDTLLSSARKTCDNLRLQFASTGDYVINENGWYVDLMTYMGDTQQVESAIIEDKLLYSNSKAIFIYNDFDFQSGTNLLMIYTLSKKI